MSTYTLYWIRREQHKDPRNEGYIGITSCGLDQRFTEHRYGNTVISKALRKYSDIVASPLYEGLTKDDAVRLESEFRPAERIGWNLCVGGGIPPSRTGRKASEATRAKQSQSHKGKVKSEEHIRKISEALKGKPPGNAGTKRKVVQCPHCGKQGGINTMTQWHYDKCRHRRS